MERVFVAPQTGRAVSQKSKDFSRWRVRSFGFGQLLITSTLLVILLLGCHSSNLRSQSSWNTYHNPRYDFEFPYPSNWIAFPIPDNRDGRAFRDPQNPKAEIRGWAGNQLSEPKTSSPHSQPKALPKTERQNFTTAQGLAGKLQVDINSDTSLITLTLSQRQVQ